MEPEMPVPEIRLIKQVGDVKVHTCIAPEYFLSPATHIIEGPNELIVIDGQFVVPLAMAFRGYINSLGKPINRVYLSHEHVDHFFGLAAAFGDVPVYALRETIDFLKMAGEPMRASLAQVYGPMVPDHVLIPQHVVQPGKEVIDGITFVHEVYTDGEVKTQLAIQLPELGIHIVQDLIYSGCHIYVHGLEETASWIKTLEAFKQSEYQLFLPGHGAPADKQEIQANIDYLKGAVEILKASTNVEGYKAAILAKFPDRKAPAIIDIYAPRLFSPEAAH